MTARLSSNETNLGFTPQQALEPLTLHQRWQALLRQDTQLRIRQAAITLGVHEADLLATELGASVTRLDCDPISLLSGLFNVGPVRALVSNDHAVHETTGTFSQLLGSGLVRLFLGEQDQRLFTGQWKIVFAVCSHEHESLQFFNQQGGAAFKVFTTKGTDITAWETLIASHVSDDQSPHEPLPTAPTPMTTPAAPLSRNQKLILEERWAGMSDVHQFPCILRDLNIDRLTAFRFISLDWAWPVQIAAVEYTLHQCQQRKIPLMTFVSNGDAAQIHTAVPVRLLRTGLWFNILDPCFNLHLNTQCINSAWVVRRPTKDGVVTALEAFDINGSPIIQFVGAHHEGEPELPSWRSLTQELPSEL